MAHRPEGSLNYRGSVFYIKRTLFLNVMHVILAEARRRLEK